MEGPLFITPKGADEPMSLAPSSSFAQPGLDTTPKRLGGGVYFGRRPLRGLLASWRPQPYASVHMHFS